MSEQNLGTVLEEIRGRLVCVIWELTYQCGQCGLAMQSQIFDSEIATDMQARARRGECLCSSCRDRRERNRVLELVSWRGDPTGTF